MSFGEGFDTALGKIVEEKKTVIAKIKVLDKNGETFVVHRILKGSRDFNEQEERKEAKKHGYDFQGVEFFEVISRMKKT